MCEHGFMSDETVSADSHPAIAKRIGRLERMAEHPRLRPITATAKRFFAIEGLDLGGLIAVELFTTILPLLLIAYAWYQNFSSKASVGELFVQQLGAHGKMVLTIRREFGTAAGLHQVWTVAGMLGFLFWGIPMSLTISRMFALAWQRPQYSIGQRLWRGTVWFVMYLATAAVVERIMLISDRLVLKPVLVPLAMVVSTVFWGSTPMLLAPNVPRTWRTLLAAGLTGAVINVAILRWVVRIVFPLLLSGWTGFGPVGVAFTIMTWSGVTGVVWVVVACAGAVFSERSWLHTEQPVAATSVAE
jgi:hypothetical protein